MMKYVDVAVFDTVKAALDGKFESKVQELGIKENGVGTTDFEFTKDKIGEEIICIINIYIVQKDLIMMNG